MGCFSAVSPEFFLQMHMYLKHLPVSGNLNLMAKRKFDTLCDKKKKRQQTKNKQQQQQQDVSSVAAERRVRRVGRKKEGKAPESAMGATLTSTLVSSLCGIAEAEPLTLVTADPNTTTAADGRTDGRTQK